MKSVPGADPKGITRIQMCDGDRGIKTVDLPDLQYMLSVFVQ